MTVGKRYDTKLLAYQGVLEIPFQVMMYDLYGKLQPNSSTYAAMSILNLGLWTLNQKISAELYNAMHPTSPQKNIDYYVSFLTEYNYKHLEKNTVNIPIGDRNDYSKKTNQILVQAPAYSKGYFDGKLGAYALKSAYGTLVNYNKSKNALGSLAYGLSQPLAVILRDAKRK